MLYIALPREVDAIVAVLGFKKHKNSNGHYFK